MTPLYYVLIATVTLQLDTPSQRELAERIKAARTAIETAVIDCDVRRYDVSDQSPTASAELVATYHCSFDKHHLRADVRQPRSRSGLGDHAGFLVRRQILGDDSLTSHSNELSRGLPLSVRIDHGQALKSLEAEGKVRIFDPRSIGLFIVAPGQLHAVRKSELPISPQPGIDCRIIEAVQDGTRCWQVDLSRIDSGASATYWVAPELGFTFLRAVVTVQLDDSILVDAIQCKIKQYGASKTWFPETVEFHRKINDQSVIRDVIMVTNADFNQPIDALREFTLVGFELPAGIDVYEYPANKPGARKWDGQQLISDVRTTKTKVLLKNESRMSFIVAANLAIVGIIFLIIYFRRQYVQR